MIGNPFERLGKRVVEAIEQAIDKLSPPSSSPSLGLAGATGSVVRELDELSAPVAAKGVPRDSNDGNSYTTLRTGSPLFDQISVLLPFPGRRSFLLYLWRLSHTGRLTFFSLQLRSSYVRTRSLLLTESESS